MLFLCGGKAAFKRDPVSIGALLLAVYPSFPAKTADNKSYLQVIFPHFVAAICKKRAIV